MKRTISLILALSMLLSLLPAAAVHAAEPLPFRDVAHDSWYYDAVDFAYRFGIINGTGPDTFSPNANITREMVYTILWRHAGCPEVENIDDHLMDIPAGAWYTDAAHWAFAQSIAVCVTPCNLGIGIPLTRTELCTIMRSYAHTLGLNTDGCCQLPEDSDVNTLDVIRRKDMNWAIAVGLIVGKGGGRMDPQGTLTRAEFITVFRRFLDCPLFTYRTLIIEHAPEHEAFREKDGIDLTGLRVVAERMDGTRVPITDYQVFCSSRVSPIHTHKVSWGGLTTFFYAAYSSNTGKYDIDAAAQMGTDYLRQHGFDVELLPLNCSTWDGGDLCYGWYIDAQGGEAFFRQWVLDYLDYEISKLPKDVPPELIRVRCFIAYDEGTDAYHIIMPNG